MTGEPRGVSRVLAGFSSFDGEYSLPHVLAQGSPIFHSSFKGELGIALESLQGKIDLEGAGCGSVGDVTGAWLASAPLWPSLWT